MLRFLKVVLFLSILSPVSALADTAKPYDSYQSLLQTFYKAGFDKVFEVPGGDFSALNIIVHTPQDTNAKGIGIANYSNSAQVRVPSLDFIESSSPLSYATAEAYKVADVLLCYRLTGPSLHALISQGKTLKCLMFPVQIEEVVLAVNSVK